MRYVFLLFAAGVTVGTYLLPASGADIPLPKPRPNAEACLKTGNEPKPGQVLQPDETCPTKLRWRNPR